MKNLVYLDTNVFGHLYDQTDGITQDVVEQLKSVVADEKVSIVLSLLNFEEVLAILGPRGRNVEQAAKRMQFVLELADLHKIVKQPMDLLTDDIYAYACTGMEADPFLSDSKVATVQNNIQEFLRDFSMENIVQLLSIIHDTKNHREAFQLGMQKGKVEFLPKYKKLKAQGKAEKPPFEEFLARQSEGIAEAFAKKVGLLEACQEKGIPGLLDRPSVKMSVGITLSHLYSQWFEKHQPQKSDSQDILHATAAAATTKTFITHDERLRKHVLRVSLDDFQAKSLNDLLSDL